MKIYTKVISPLGTFESDLSDDFTPEKINEAREFLEQCSKMNHLSIVSGNETIYFPAEVIRKSILILGVFE